MDITFLVSPYKKTEVLKNKFNPFLNKLDLPLLEEIEYLSSDGEILFAELLRNIQSSALVIVDVSLGLTNVYFEYGLARGLNKPIVLLFEKEGQESHITRILEKFKESGINDEIIDIPSVIKRYFSLGNDLGGVIYTSFGEKDEAKLENKITSAIKNAFSRSFKIENQISELCVTQFIEYLKLVKTQREFLFYLNFENNETEILKFYEVVQNNIKIDHADFYIHFNSIPLKSNPFTSFIDGNIDRLFFTNFIFKYDIVVFFNDCFFAIKGEKIIFERPKNVEEINNALIGLKRKSIKVGSQSILKHLIEIKDVLSTKDFEYFNKNGFSFQYENNSRLCLKNDCYLRSKIDDKQVALSIKDKTEKIINRKFLHFSRKILENINTIIAIWPLSEQGINLFFEPSVQEWVKEIENWAENTTHFIFRVFTLEEYKINSEGERDTGMFRIKDGKIILNTSFSKNIDTILNTFRDSNYSENIHIFFHTEDTHDHFFEGTDGVSIFEKNAILFASDFKEEIITEVSNGVFVLKSPQSGYIQIEEYLNIDSTNIAINNYRYYIIPFIGNAHEYDNYLKEFKDIFSIRNKRITKKVPSSMTLREFLNPSNEYIIRPD
jgi:hypothetical protein